MRAGHEDIRTRPGTFTTGDVVDAAIHLNAELQPHLTTPGLEPLDLGDALFDERLPAKPRIDRHHQHQVHLGQIRANRRDVRRRIHRQPHLLAHRPDAPQERVDQVAQLHVDGHGIGPGLHERLEQDLRLRAHQVNVEMPPKHLAHRLGHLRPEGDVRDEVPIHDVQMQPLRTRTLDARRLMGEATEIRGQ